MRRYLHGRLNVNRSLNINRSLNVGVFMLALSTAGCGYLIQPSVKTEMVELKKGSYTLDQGHATLLFKVDHMGFSQYVGRFNDFDAQLEFNPDDPTAAQLDAVVELASVDTNDARMEDTLKDTDWFNVIEHPQARFTTVAAEKSGNGLRFTGNLTLRGHTVPVQLQVDFNGAGFNALSGHYTLGFAASSHLKRSEFGMNRYIPAIGDTVELEVHAEFQRQ